jgi:hypothetical protein
MPRDISGIKKLWISRKDRVAIVFCASQKTLALGIVLIGILFEHDPSIPNFLFASFHNFSPDNREMWVSSVYLWWCVAHLFISNDLNWLVNVHRYGILLKF